MRFVATVTFNAEDEAEAVEVLEEMAAGVESRIVDAEVEEKTEE